MVTTKQLNVKRVCYVSRKPFREVLESLDAGVGHPDMAELWRNILEANTVSEVDEIMRSSVGSSGLIEFLRFNHGEVVHKAKPEACQASCVWWLGIPALCGDWRNMCLMLALTLL